MMNDGEILELKNLLNKAITTLSNRKVSFQYEDEKSFSRSLTFLGDDYTIRDLKKRPEDFK